MTKWEYFELAQFKSTDNQERHIWEEAIGVTKGVVLGSPETCAEYDGYFEDTIAELGRQGWELIFFQPPSAGPVLRKCMFKRELEGGK